MCVPVLDAELCSLARWLAHNAHVGCSSVVFHGSWQDLKGQQPIKICELCSLYISLHIRAQLKNENHHNKLAAVNVSNAGTPWWKCSARFGRLIAND